MKSDKALEREIKTVADLINGQEYGAHPSLNVPSNTEAGRFSMAIYRTLLWARGRREEYPSIVVRQKFEEGK